MSKLRRGGWGGVGGAAVRERQGWKSALRVHMKEAEQHAEHKPSPQRHLRKSAGSGVSAG